MIHTESVTYFVVESISSLIVASKSAEDTLGIVAFKALKSASYVVVLFEDDPRVLHWKAVLEIVIKLCSDVYWVISARMTATAFWCMFQRRSTY